MAPVDLFDPDTQENWYPAYEKLQAEAPVFKVPGLNMFVLTRYEDIAAVVRDSDTFSNQAELHGGEPLMLFPEARRIYEERGFPRKFPLAVDPPEHQKYRKLVDHFFRGSRLTGVRPLITEIVHGLIDKFAHKGEIEFIKAFAEPLPANVISRLLGFPQSDIPQLHVWAEAWAAPFARNLTLEKEIWVAEQGVAFQQYILEHINDRRKSPKDDIISHLVQARFDDERPLADAELVSIIDHLYIGGNETTAYALASGMWQMLREPQIYAQLKADKSRTRNFVEENLRLESPTQGLYRTTTRDTEIRGVKIPQGATVHLRFAAANRDPAVFENPARFDLNRPNAIHHMAFSQAEHRCPGFSLSKFEQWIAFDALIERLPNLRLTSGKNDFRHLPGFVLRALAELHLSFDPVAS